MGSSPTSSSFPVASQVGEARHEEHRALQFQRLALQTVAQAGGRMHPARNGLATFGNRKSQGGLGSVGEGRKEKERVEQNCYVFF